MEVSHSHPEGIEKCCLEEQRMCIHLTLLSTGPNKDLFIQVSVITVCINRKYLYNFFFTLLHVWAVVFGHLQVIHIFTLLFLLFSPSIGQCLHLGEGHVCCIQYIMPVFQTLYIYIDLRFIEIVMTET
jgi:hypothetical protein